MEIDSDIKQKFEDSKLDVSDETIEQLVEIADRSDNSIETVISDAEWKSQGEGVKDESSLVKVMTNFYKVDSRQDTTVFKGMLLGYTDPQNIRQGIIQQKMNMEKDNSRKAQKEGHIDANGQPVWHPSDSGMPNDANIGDPIEPMYVRNYFGFATDEDESGVYFFTMARFDGDEDIFRNDEQIPLGKPVKFSAAIREDDVEGFLSLTHVDETVFNQDDSLDVPEKDTLYSEYLPTNFDFNSMEEPDSSTISIDEAKDMVESGYRFNNPRVFHEVRVRNVTAGSDNATYKVMDLDSEEPARLVQIPDYLDEGSLAKNQTVSVLGVPWMPNDPDEDQLLLIRPVDVSGAENVIPESQNPDLDKVESTDEPNETESTSLGSSEGSNGDSTSEMFSPDDEEESEEEAEEEAEEEETEEDSDDEAVEGTTTKSQDEEDEESGGLFE